MLSRFTPILRALTYGTLKRRAQWRVAGVTAAATPPNHPLPAAFIIGCGRSGTSILGDIFRTHRAVCYFFEPYHLWATVDPAIDVLNLYHHGPAHLLLDEKDVWPLARQRFDRLFRDGRGRHCQIVIEKTPFNACRIGYIEGIAPASRYVNVNRDGLDVARSIDRLARDQRYKIAGRPLNRWWGRDHSKWKALAADGIAAGYFPDEVPLLSNDSARGAYEWIVSQQEVRRWRDKVGDRLLDISYDDLAAHPKAVTEQICRFLQIEAAPDWLDSAVRPIDPPRRNHGRPLVLPPRMCEAFNALQAELGFPGRATPGMPQATQAQIALISNEPTPYRLHVLDRLANELPEVNVHNIFTHTISKASMPWQLQIDPKLNPVFFPANHLRSKDAISLRALRLFDDIRDYLRRNNIRLIVLLGYNDLTRRRLIHWAKQENLPLFLTADSNIFADAGTRAGVRWIKRRWVRWVLRHIAGLMPMGTCGRAYFRSYLDHRLPEFLFPYEPNYPALRAGSPEQQQAFASMHGLSPERKRFLYCGRLVAVKSVDILLDAFAAMAPERPDWDLVIAGDGPLRKSLEDRVPPALRSRVKWLGFLQFEQTTLCYHVCQVLVHPAHFEPWGLVINEAVATGLPVVTTSVVGAAVELVRHRINGLIVAPRSVREMTDALLHVSLDGVWQEMSRRSAEMLATWQKAGDPVDGLRQVLTYTGIGGSTLTPQTPRDDRAPASSAGTLAPLTAGH